MHRRRTLWLRVLGAVGVVALAVVAVVLLLGGGGGSLLPGGDEGPSGFEFELATAKASPTTDSTPADLQSEADAAAAAVKSTMDHYYFSAFVDRDAWGDYTDAYALLDDAAAAKAETDADVVTLGTTASDRYGSIADPRGTLHVLVLTNEHDHAVSAIARVTFRLDAELTDGGANQVTSTGSFFLRPGEDGWVIYAYRVDRNERPAPSPSPTGSPT